MMLRLLLFSLLFAAWLPLSSFPAAAEKRLAFVIGINTYDNMVDSRQLKRAVNDARSVAASLTNLGYDVIADENVSRARFNELWQKLLDKIAPGDTVVFYFSGHGVEIEGLNFLLARDLPEINYGRQEQLKREALSVQEFLLDLRRRKPRISVLILDACRDHPLVPAELKTATGSRGGLAKMDAPEGTFIMYAAGAGETALDRLPRNDPDPVNSVYTRKLLPLMSTAGLGLRDLAVRLRLDVKLLAATVPHTQRPTYYDGLDGEFYLAGRPVESPVLGRPETSAPSTAAETVRICSQVAAISSIATLEALERQYKETRAADCISARIGELKAAAKAVEDKARAEAERKKAEDEAKAAAKAAEDKARAEAERKKAEDDAKAAAKAAEDKARAETERKRADDDAKTASGQVSAPEPKVVKSKRTAPAGVASKSSGAKSSGTKCGTACSSIARFPNGSAVKITTTQDSQF